MDILSIKFYQKLFEKETIFNMLHVPMMGLVDQQTRLKVIIVHVGIQLIEIFAP